MVFVYAKELQGNKDKYVMHFVAEMVVKSIEKKLITLENLYAKKESEIIDIFRKNFVSWEKFTKAKEIVCTNEQPKNFYVSINAKNRNVIPLISHHGEVVRINKISKNAKRIYNTIEDYKDTLYGYVKEIEKI